MAIADFFRKTVVATKGIVEAATNPTKTSDDGIFKAYIPDFLYKPAYGMPRKDNTPQMKLLSANPYVFPIIKTLSDEVTTVGWEIKLKEEFQEEMKSSKKKDDDDDVEEKAEHPDYDAKIKEITRFMRNPNGNEESFGHLLRQLVTDICEVDAGVLVKVFNEAGEFKQMFVRDGSLFLKNPDIYGYIGDRADFVSPLPDGFAGVKIDQGGSPTPTQENIMKQYSLLYKEDAAYFQYGWTAGSMPIPFGKREVVYMMQNPRADSIYGRSPISVLMNTILNLIYGIDFNLDYYINNNTPDGVLSLLGADANQIKQYRENMEAQISTTDEFGKRRKTFFKAPIVNTDVKFVPTTFTSKDMEIIAQQQWFTKVLWMSFGVTADEMGFTEDSNRAVGAEQVKVFKRKALGPLLEVIQYHLNTQILPEFFAQNGELPDSADVPLMFEFDTYDIDEDLKQLQVFKIEKELGIKSDMMIAKERGINVEELQEEKDKQKAEEQEMFEQQNTAQEENPPQPQREEEKKPKENKKPEEKSKKKSPLSQLNEFIDGVGDEIVKTLEETHDDALSL